MKRKIEKDLMSWKCNNNRKPMLIIGVRQIGKTHTTRKFVKGNFDNYFYFNLESDSIVKEIFNKTIDANEIIKYIEIEKEILIPQGSAIIFDEIQINPRAITSLKYFNEDRKDLAIIGTGSLLGTTLSKNSNLSFPVGNVEMVNMYPFSFDEFLDATNNTILKNEIISVTKQVILKNKVKNKYHTKAVELYNEYLYVGGMPESIINYLDNDKQCHKMDDKIIKNLYNGYISDMTKYNSNTSEMSKVLQLYHALPANLNKPNKKFKYSLIDNKKNNRASSYESALDWLISSNLILAIKKVKDIKLPLKSYLSKDFKAFFSDVGLLRSVSEVRYKDLINDLLGDIKGALAENYVAIELASLGYTSYYYKKNKPVDMEIDTLITTKKYGIVPIEVKSGTRIKSLSLKKYIGEFNPDLSIRFSLKNFGYENEILSIPLYAVFVLKEIL